ncbi:MAG: hypothetical protein Q4B01_08235 [Eubacteriales bacterium]|nr:hypothetical protein [Eubacteriales bacterium]
MGGIREILEAELKSLEQIRAELGEADHGSHMSLRISNDHGRTRYYRKTGEKKYEYINRKDLGSAKELAQKKYENDLIRLLERRISQWKKILRDYSDTEIDDLYEAEREERKALIVPVREGWEEYQRKWYQEPYEGKIFLPDTPVILTEKGERVRSKSEKILADYLHRKGIPYKYEKPLKLRGAGIIYPDFTLLSSRTRKEIYWEHDGRMDDPEYAKKAVQKINLYVRNGIMPGNRLLITYETSSQTLQMDIVEKLLENILE